MPVNFWTNNDSYDELDSLNAFLSELAEAEPDASTYRSGLAGRRRKAAVVLIVVWSSTIALHCVSWGALFVWGLTTVLGVQALRVFLARPPLAPQPLVDDPARTKPREKWPFVSLLVAAKNEETVIENLIHSLCNLDYPDCRYEVWVIDDNSTDKTPLVLETLTQKYDQLRVLRRPAGAGGGKSGALNQAMGLTHGEIIAVFDADAQVTPDVLRRVVPVFAQKAVGAVQLRKTIANARTNFWTRGQQAEMAFDTFIHQQRVAVGGIGELRGNGQFVRRAALRHCGGWNEATITDDLDLTLRLHLDQWEIQVLTIPTVLEEGVTHWTALWHQRNRWAEGGYQRYLDYWRFLIRNRLGLRKSFDLFAFWLIQYIVPTASVPDLLMAIARNRPPLLMPVSTLTVTLSLAGIFMGLRRIQLQESLEAGRSRSWHQSRFRTLMQTVQGVFYMFHWFIVMASVTARMAIRPKRLRWVKTAHHGIATAIKPSSKA